MYNLISSEALATLKTEYTKGSRVELVFMDDPYSQLCPGEQGTVEFVDDIGTVFVAWDSGSSLGIIYGVDTIKRL